MAPPRVRRIYLSPPVGAPIPWVVGLLLPGVALVAGAGGTGWRQETNWWRYKVAIVIALLGVLPPVNRSVAWVLKRLRHPSVRGAAVIGLTITLLATNYFIFTGLRQGREMIPKLPDEHVYLLQAQMAAHARLWMPGLPVPHFFQTPFVFVRPLYAPVCFPGTALLYAPLVWINLSPWIWAAWISGVAVGLTYRALVELIDGVSALLGALLLLSLPIVHLMSLMVLSHPASLMLGLLMIWSWLRWRRRKRIAWIVALGFLSGWNAVTRPIDALCFAIPVAAAVLWELRAENRRAIFLNLAAGCLAAAPFLAMQFSFDRAVTGRSLQTPVALYDRLHPPQAELGPAAPEPHLPSPAKLSRMQRLSDLLRAVLPVPLLLVFAPLGLIGLREWKRWIMFLALPLFIYLYAFDPRYLSHYALIVAPASIMLVVMGTQALGNAFGRYRERAEVVIAMALAAVSLTSLSELNPWLSDPNVDAPMLADSEHKLSEITRPAVVLFHSEPGNDGGEEPVYNISTPWPDDAQVIRAHDLGARNIELFRYYADRPPHRMIYLYDESTYELRELGMADALARQGGEGGR